MGHRQSSPALYLLVYKIPLSANIARIYTALFLGFRLYYLLAFVVRKKQLLLRVFERLALPESAATTRCLVVDNRQP
jgi:hypothetical protein